MANRNNGVTDRQRGIFEIDFSETEVWGGHSFDDLQQETLKKKLVEFFGYPSFSTKECLDSFGDKKIIELHI